MVQYLQPWVYLDQGTLGRVASSFKKLIQFLIQFMNTDIFESHRSSLSSNRVIATVASPSAKVMPRIVEALLEGGIRWIEITLRTSNALELIRLSHREYPEMNILAGTVIECDQVKQVRDAGAQIAVAPNLSTKVLEVAKAEALPFVPGVATPSEIGLGIELGYHIFKFSRRNDWRFALS